MKAGRLKKTYKRARMFSKFKNIAVFMFIFLNVVVIYIFIDSKTVNSIFPVRHVVFIGNRHLTDDELEELAGIKKIESLITISNKKVSQNLLKSPWIRSVSVRKEIPETLSLTIEEAMPFALLDMNGHLFLVDENGKLLEELKGDSIPFLPIIAGDPFKEKEGFSDAIKLARLMNDKGFSSEIEHIEINLRKPHELTVTLDGTVVKMGEGRYEEKLEKLIELEEEIQNRRIPVDYIDLRFENKAIVKPINNEEVK
jgi:cell division protein FtsQ